MDDEAQRRASDPQTSAPELRALAEQHQPELLLRVASNPNAPADLLLRLAVWAPDEVLANEALRLHALSHGAAVLDGVSTYALSSLLAHPRGGWLLGLAVVSPSSLVRREAARSPLASDEQLAALARDPDDIVRLLVATRPALPEPLAVSLAADLQPRVRMRLSVNRSCPPAVLATLAGDPDDTVRRNVTYNTATPPAALLRILQNSTAQTVAQATRSPRLPPEALTRLTQSPLPELRAAAAQNPALPPDLLLALARDPDPSVRAAAASERLPDEALRQLADDNDSDVRRAVALCHATPPELLQRLGRDPSEHVRDGVAANPHAPPSVLEELVHDEHARHSLAANPSMPPACAHALAALSPGIDEGFGFIDILFDNPATPPDLLEALSEQIDPSTEFNNTNPSMPLSVLERFARGTEAQKRYVCKSSGCPAPLLHSLAWDRDASVAWAARQRAECRPLLALAAP